MGLAEKRVVAACQKDHYPAWEQKVQDAAGFPIAISVEWSEMVKEGFLDSYPANLDYNFFTPLQRAFESICQDDLGRDSLKATFQNVKITSNRSWSSLEVRVEGDTIHLDADPSYERTDAAVADHTDRIIKVLEPAL